MLHLPRTTLEMPGAVTRAKTAVTSIGEARRNLVLLTPLTCPPQAFSKAALTIATPANLPSGHP